MHRARPPDRGSRPTSEYTASHSISTATSPHCFVPCSTKTVSQNQPLETAASKPVESPKSVSGDWLPTPEIARNRANSRVSQESKLETGLVGWGGSRCGGRCVRRDDAERVALVVLRNLVDAGRPAAVVRGNS